MKKLNIAIVSISCVVMISSCEKEEMIKKTIESRPNAITEEMLNSASAPAFQKSYSADLTFEEASARFREDLETFKNSNMGKKYKNDLAGSCPSGYWYIIWTFTTDITTNRIWAGNTITHDNFVTMTQGWTLNEPGNIYPFGWRFTWAHYTQTTPSTVELKRVKLASQGSDQWCINDWDVIIDSEFQSSGCNASGKSSKRTQIPNGLCFNPEPNNNGWSKIWDFPAVNSGTMFLNP